MSAERPAARPRLICFDLDDTLWPCAPVIHAAEAALYDWLSGAAPRLTAAEDLVSLRAHRLAFMRREPSIAHDLGEVRRRSLAELLVAHDYDVSVSDDALALFMQHRNRIEPFAEVAAVLARLRPDHCLISLTNGNSDPEQTPLAGLFHHSLTAASVGSSKPDPAMFRRALELSGVTPERAIHVGDEPRLDVVAAAELGMITVWMDRVGREWPADVPVRPAARVCDMNEFEQWLTRADDAL